MDALITIYNTLPVEVSLLQTSVLKCLCRDARKMIEKSDEHHRRMSYLSWALFCDFNMSPAIFREESMEIVLMRSVESGMDPDMISAAHELGWRYNYRTMKNAVTCGFGLSVMRTLRDISCHWGCETLDILVEKSCEDTALSDVHEMIEFCVSDGYPVTYENVEHACRKGTARALSAIVSVYIMNSCLRNMCLPKCLRDRMIAFDLVEQFRSTYFEHAGPFPLWWSNLITPGPNDTREIIDELWNWVQEYRAAGLLICKWTRDVI